MKRMYGGDCRMMTLSQYLVGLFRGASRFFTSLEAPRRRTLVVLALVLLALWLALSLKTVQIAVDGREVVITTHAATVADALRQAEVKLGPKDVVRPDSATRLTRKMSVTVTRANTVTLKVDGYGQILLTAQPTVGEALAEAGVALGPADRVTPALDAKITPGLTIQIVRVEEEVAVEQVVLPYRLERHEDTTMDAGQTRLLQKGEEGLKEVTYRLLYEDGRLIKKEVQSEKIVKEPVTEVVAYGTAGTISRGGRTIRYKKVLDMLATAYTAGPESTGPYATGYTSTGIRATYGIVAVDPRVIPLHTRLYIDGYGFAVAEDTGGAIKGNRIDLCYDSVQEALDWGRRWVKVYILD